MDDNKISSSKASGSHSSGTGRPVKNKVECYVTDMVIESTLEVNHFRPAVINVDILDSTMSGPKDVLIFNKKSPNKWYYDGIIAIKEEITLIARWDDTESFGYVFLKKSEPKNDKTQEVIQELVTEGAGPQMRIIFTIKAVLQDVNMLHLEGGMLTVEKPVVSLSDNLEGPFAWLLRISDKIQLKALWLKTIGDMFLARFFTTGNGHDIDNSILAYKTALQLLPDTHAELAGLHNKYGIAIGEQSNYTWATPDIDPATSSLRKSVQLTPCGHASLPGRLYNLGTSLQKRFTRTRDLNDISEAIACFRKSVQFTHEGHSDLSNFLNNLSMSLGIRFTRTRDLTDISEALSSLQRAIQITPDGHASLPLLLINLGVLFQTRFQHTGNLSDLSEAITSKQKAVQLTPEGSVSLPARLQNLSVSLRARFERTGTLNDVSEAIACQHKSVYLIPDGHKDLPAWLKNLGLSLQTRFGRTGNLADITEAILFLRKSIQLAPEGHMHDYLNNLAMSLGIRFTYTGNLTDISEALSTQERAVQLTPADHADLPALLANLGYLSQARFQCTRDPVHLDKSISSNQKSVQLTPNGHVDLPLRLSNLGNSLRARFQNTGNLTDIVEAISCQRTAVRLTPEGHTGLPAQLSHLGISLRIFSERRRDLDDINEAISLQRKSIQLTPVDHANLKSYLGNLGASLGVRFMHTRDPADISEAVSTLQKEIELTPEDHADLPAALTNLGYLLQTRFQLTGNIVYLSEAISSSQKSVCLTPEGHTDLPSRLANLGACLRARFQRTGSLNDISEAIFCHRRSVQLTPEDNVDLPAWLTNLGVSLQTRFGRTGDLFDITEAISSQRKSVHLTPEGHTNLRNYMNNLGIMLGSRYTHTKDPSDIHEALESLQKAIRMTPDDHPGLSQSTKNLALSFRARFEHIGSLADISEAISLLQRSVQLTPSSHPDVAGLMRSLADAFLLRFEHTRDEADIVGCTTHYRMSAISISGPPSTRLAAAEQWALLSRDRSSSLEAYRTAIHLLSQVAGLDQTIQSRYTNLINVSDLSSSAAAAALGAGKHDLALEWLGQGRCIVWNQLNNLRSSVDGIRAHNPALADEILRVSNALENAGSRVEAEVFTKETTWTTKLTIQDEVHNHIQLAQTWDRLVKEARAIPEFRDFLRPTSCSTLLNGLPDSGHVVIINIHKSRSDALVLTFGTKQPLHVALPEFPHAKADVLRHNLKAVLHDSRIRMRGYEQDTTRGSRRYMAGITEILCQLWTCVVKPILDCLGYSTPVPKKPRIWWCVTGPLAFLPIHAAGIYKPSATSPGTCICLSDFAVSSYTPSIWTLFDKKHTPREVRQKKTGLLMISQPDTPNMCRIPGTTTEVRAIKELFADENILCLESGDATVERVRTNMDTYSCVHFACHASQNTKKPLESGFYLYDGRLELSAIMKERLEGADLAFLSACQTSAGDERLSEEAVHLAGGMLAAGYRGVVATMWSIQDNYGPKLAKEFYKNLGNDEEENSQTSSRRLTSDGAAYALHHATQQLRKNLNGSESSLLTWVPFVHYGL